MKVTITGFNKLDFDEAKKIAEIIAFDVTQCVKNVKSCGYSRYYLANDKRYFITMLLRHIDSMIQSKDTSRRSDMLPQKVTAWYKKAKVAAQEYSAIEEHHLKIRKHLGKGQN